MRIVVAEDDDVFRTLLRTVISEGGHEVLAAPDGACAWEYIRGSGADLCLLDVDMPVMNGIELLRKIRSDSRFCRLPVIMLTVRALVEDQLDGYDAGADDYIPKPVAAEVLLARVAALGRKAGRLEL